MRAPKISRHLMAFACAALLLLAGSAPAGLAQRRRARPQPRRAPAASPARATTAPSPTPAPNPSANTGATQTPATAPTTPAAEQGAQAQRRPEADPAFEELLVADGYTVYAEIRRIGALALTEEVKSAVAALSLLGGDEVRPVTDFYKFVHDNAETLGESRVVLAFMPARAGLPQGVAAVEFESPAAAAAFEPKYRRLVAGQIKSYTATKKQETPQTAATARGRRTQPAAASMNDEVAQMLRGFTLRRVGRWLVSADAPFTFKKLRGEEGEPRLADSPRFQSVRSRFADDSLFVYVDTNVAQQGWALQMAKAEEERQKMEAQGPPPESVEVVGRGSGMGVMTSEAPAAASTPTLVNPLPPPAAGDATPEPSPEEEPDPEASPEEATSATAVGVVVEDAPPPSAEELAVSGMGRVLRNIWGGAPRIPGAVAFGLGLDRGALAMRLAVENSPDGTIAVIPFLPNVVSGAPVTAETVEVMPADAELYVAGSLDWTQLYNSTLGAASINPAGLMGEVYGGEGEGVRGGERPPSPDETIAAVEKLFGFKFKEDLLPSLGAEVGFSMPLEESDFGLFTPGRRAGEKKEERDAEPGPLFVATLNDTEKMRRILPRVFVALGFASPGAPQRPEKREGVEITTLGASDGLSYAIVNNFLVMGELKAVRYCVDSFTSRRTLATSNAYRDATSWQAKQKVVHLFLSDTLFRRLGDQTRKRSEGSIDPAVRLLLAQLEAAEYAPASYEATNEGDVLLHQMRLPLSLVKAYATATAVMAKDGPVLMGEMSAFYALQRVAAAELRYKEEKKMERYGTLEELLAEKMLERGFLENIEYKIELSATANKFEATATPKNYGKTGRRSFYIDETMTVRAADRKGERATVSDPETEQ